MHAAGLAMIGAYSTGSTGPGVSASVVGPLDAGPDGDPQVVAVAQRRWCAG
ncbi:MAG: hypothetical protein AVDCRST_MAG66-1690 [uncultured Pseudonocardia sp.]|uniref:Uncharacterized protein n=1 Tax=uncultured Pseudonocardia sp. TaxID=211455 RepID=A0A6J4P5Z7_9PSEU|nr:MAG: hypothetical protein AVDCRST_MAG66-1690 [uncultured Pseudonocardia sp.]